MSYKICCEIFNTNANRKMQNSTLASEKTLDSIELESDFDTEELPDVEEEEKEETDSQDSQEPLLLRVPERQKITYSTHFEVSKSDEKKLLSIKKTDFSIYEFDKKPFIEQIIHYKDKPLYVHLFFDVDDIKSPAEYEEFVKWLDSLKPVFQDYCIGGYCNNEEMAAYGFKLIANAKKYLSFHVSFYQTALDADDAHLICRKSTKGMHPKIDESVYKIQNPSKSGDPSKETQKQVMRFALSDKVYVERPDPRNARAAGSIIGEGKYPFMCTYQVWGGERIIRKKDWSTLFTISKEEKKSKKVVLKKDEKKAVADTTNTTTNIAPAEDGNPELYAEPDYIIPVEDDVILKLLNEFEPTHKWLEQVGCSLMNSPFDKDKVRDLLKKWYFQDGTHHHNERTVDGYVDDYYKREFTNRWLFSIIKKIPNPAKKKEWIDEFKCKGIDPDLEPDPRDDFSLTNIRKKYTRKDGKGIDAMRFMNDLKRIAVLLEADDDTGTTLVAFKCFNAAKKMYRIKITTEDSFISLLRKYNIGYYYKNGKAKQVNAAMVYNEGLNKNCLVRKTLRFYDTDPKVYSYFHGYDYKELADYDEKIISGYLNHILYNIANANEELYNYILNWIAYVLQNPDGKTGTCLVITGEQGTGKNTFTDVICNLMNRYSLRNLTDIGHLVGRFNSVVENNKLIVCNEMASADRNIRLNSDALKSIITDKETGVESKYVEVRFVQNVVNLIILSNHFDPVKVEKLDRRYVICETNDSHANDRKYFGEMIKSFTPEFYQHLFTFFMKRDLSNVDVGDAPNTVAKQILVDANRSTYELFIQDFIIDFKKGFVIDDAYTYYNKWAFLNGFITKDKKVEKSTFCKNILPFMDKKQKRFKEDDTRKWVYKLKPEKEKYFALDKYDRKGEDDHKEEEQEEETNDTEEYNDVYEDFKSGIYRKCSKF